MGAGSDEDDIDDIIDEICNDSSFARTPLVSTSLEKGRKHEVQWWKKIKKHYKLKLI